MKKEERKAVTFAHKPPSPFLFAARRQYLKFPGKIKPLLELPLPRHIFKWLRKESEHSGRQGPGFLGYCVDGSGDSPSGQILLHQARSRKLGSEERQKEKADDPTK